MMLEPSQQRVICEWKGSDYFNLAPRQGHPLFLLLLSSYPWVVVEAKAAKDSNRLAISETAPNEDTDKLYIFRPGGRFRSSLVLPL